MAQLYRDGGMI